MKNVFLFLITNFIIPVTCFSQDYLGQFTYMPAEEVVQKWGKENFDPKKFKELGGKGKAKMVSSLLASKRYLGKPIKKVFNELGPSTGYFFSESVPAYIIGDTNGASDELWQVVFLLTKDSQKITNIRVQKKCCYQ